MTVLADLSKSVSEMTEEELLARVRELRISRGISPPTKERKKKAAPKPINLASLDKEAAAGLLALLEGLDDD